MKRRRRNLPRTEGRNRRRAIAGALTGVLLVGMLVVVGLGNATAGGSNASAAASQYTAYTATPLGTLDGGSWSSAQAVNARGWVVGISGTSSGSAPFLWSTETGMIDLGKLDGESGGAFGINDRGQVVGSSGYPSRAFLWDRGTMIDLEFPSSASSAAQAINNRGEIVVNSDWDAFLWRNGEVTTLVEDGSALDINDRGQIVGYFNSGGASHAFLWENGDFEDLGPGYAWQINNRGDIVGWRPTPPDDYWQACLWRDDGVVPLGTLGSGYGSTAYAINESGVIVGGSSTGDWTDHAVVWKEGVIADLTPESAGVAYGINDRGQIVGSVYGQATLWQAAP